MTGESRTVDFEEAEGMTDERCGDGAVLVIDVGPGSSNQRVNEEFFVVLRAALDRDARFGVVVVKSDVDPHDVRRSPAELAGIRWLKAARDRIAERCAGIAYVVSGQDLDSELVRRGIAAGPQVFGCPTAVFTDLDDARRWVTDALAAEPVR